MHKQRLLRLPAAFLGTLALLLAVLLAVNAIPRAALARGLTASADYYAAYGVRRNWAPGLEQSKEDIYADAVLMNIAACMKPGLAATAAARYHDSGGYMGQSLADAVGGADANADYSRYWHGALIPVTLLLLVTDAGGVRLINALLLAALASLFLSACRKRRLKGLAAAYLLAFAATESFFVPLSIEYMPCYVLSLLAALLILRLKEENLPLLFLLTGLCTAFFDFLTVETMTLLLPLIALVALRRKRDETAGLVRSMAGYGGLWLAGYAGAFLCKWLLAAAVLGPSAWAETAAMGAEKFAGDAPANLPLGRYGSAIFNNLAGLVPTTLADTYLGVTAVLAAAGLILFCFWFLYRGRKLPRGIAPALILAGLVPYGRYLLLPYHALVHNFFTYRAQLCSLMCLFLLIGWTLDPARLRPKRRRKA
ncbi:MAG: hypothetical protein Q4C72_08470 [Eubacteriales bacterium]|nr:hypothetical protein [Eubacteriales bacterium]